MKTKGRKLPKFAEKMCPYTGLYEHACGAIKNSALVRKLRRTRVTCPECGRRMIGKVVPDGDNTCILIYIPRHKRKKWWKKVSHSCTSRS